MNEIVIEIGKPCSTMQKFVIEIVFEIVIEIVIFSSTWNKHAFFNVTGSSMPIFVIEILITFFRRSSARSEKFRLKSAKKINHRTNTAIFYVTGSTVQKIGRAAQADFFREVDGA